MPLDVLRSFDGVAPDGLRAAMAAAREAELVLIRRLMPGKAWVEAGAPDLAFDAAREAFREAHARAVRLADEAVPGPEAWADEDGDSDAWPEEPFED